MFHCSFTYVSFVLGSVYTLLLLFVIRYLFKLFGLSDPSRFSQKLFLVLVSLQCLGRVLYFFLWPYLGSECTPTASSSEFAWINGLGNIPPALFFAAFSVLVFTFARIYHKVLLMNVAKQTQRFSLLITLLVLLNCICCTSEIGEWLSQNDEKNHTFFENFTVYFMASVSLMLALLFWLYGTLLYKQVERVLKSTLPAEQSHFLPNNSNNNSNNNHLSGQYAANNLPNNSTASPYATSNALAIKSSPYIAFKPNAVNPEDEIVLQASPDSVENSHNSVLDVSSASLHQPLLTNNGLATPNKAQLKVNSTDAISKPSLSPDYYVSHGGRNYPALTEVDQVPTNRANPAQSQSVYENLRGGNYYGENSAENSPEVSLAGPNNKIYPATALDSYENQHGMNHSMSYSPPVNPMRKLALIAGICTLCLFCRTLLLIVIAITGSVFDWYVSLLYFSLSEVIPLMLMLKVFDTPTGLQANNNGDETIENIYNNNKGDNTVSVSVSVLPTVDSTPILTATTYSNPNHYDDIE
jgi:cytoskeletal protein RodZ